MSSNFWRGFAAGSIGSILVLFLVLHYGSRNPRQIGERITQMCLTYTDEFMNETTCSPTAVFQWKDGRAVIEFSVPKGLALSGYRIYLSEPVYRPK